jgi:RND family efflux transporter MFP subunit
MQYLKTLALCALASVTLSACGKPNAPPAPPIPAVSVSTPLRQNVVDWDDFTGRFEAPQTVEVRARARGYLQAVHFRDGQRVQKGQLLFTLDPRPAQAQLAAARAQSEVARSELRRAETLLAAQAISREEFEARRSAALVADAALRARQLDVEFTRVTAPISGVVSDRRVDPGNVIAGGSSNGDVLTTVVSTSPIHFVFDASEAQLLKYQRQAGSRGGAAVRIRLQDEAEPRWTGRVDFLDNAVDPASGALRLRAVVANPNGFLKPGMFGSARVEGGAAYSALLVPEDAIVADGPRKVVYVVPASGSAAGEVQARPVQTGPNVNGLRVVRTGLRPDDRVIVNGVQRVRPGVKVQARLVTATAPKRVAGAGESAPAETPAASTATSAN